LEKDCQRIASRDKTCSAGIASDGVSLSAELSAAVIQWLKDAELQLSAAAAAEMTANDDITQHDVQTLFKGL